LGKTPADPAKQEAQVRPHRGIAFDLERKVVWLATREGELYKLSYPDFKRQETLVLPQPAYELYLAEKGKLLIAALEEEKERLWRYDLAGEGNVAIFELDEKK
jgi:hypothetical protein